jgi:hypothetical protein
MLQFAAVPCSAIGRLSGMGPCDQQTGSIAIEPLDGAQSAVARDRPPAANASARSPRELR